MERHLERGSRRAARLEAKLNNAAEAIDFMEEAIAAGPESAFWWNPPLTWRQTKHAKGRYRHLEGPAVVRVKQSKSGSWYVLSMGEATDGRSSECTPALLARI